MELGIYVHIPFCLKKCLYCDFASVDDAGELYDQYIAALCREIADQGGILKDFTVDTIYIGGGTPTVLSSQQLDNILESLQINLNCATATEITIEANPGTVDINKLRAMKAAGINRISFGVQAFQDNLLTKLGRVHTAQDAVRAVLAAQQAGFENISADLMYGVPGQTTTDLINSIDWATSLDISHLSVYGLKIEEGTPYARFADQGILQLPDEDTEFQMYEAAATLLPDKGFQRYEISNYAKPGAECRHNLKYWLYKPYAGIGAAAHSFINGERRANTCDIRKYLELINKGVTAVEACERLDLKTAMSEYIFLALRTAQGLNMHDFKAEFGVNFLERHRSKIEKLECQALLFRNKDSLILSPTGMRFSNFVFRSFLPDGNEIG